MSRLRSLIVPYLPVFLFPIILFADALFGGKALYWGTPGLQFIPWRIYAWQNMAQGILPLWNPLNGMGAPLAANYQTAFFYPPGWTLFILGWMKGPSGIAWGYTLLAVLHLIWAGIGMQRFMHALGVNRLAQVVAALAFSLGGYLVARLGFFSMIWTGVWMPWILLYASEIAAPGGEFNTNRRIFPISLVVCVSFMLLAGHAQLSWYIMLFTACWVFVGGWLRQDFKNGITALSRLVIAVVLGLILAAVQLLPTAEYLQQSQRSAAVDFELSMTYSFWPWRFLTLLAPDMFGNPGLGDYWGYASQWEDAVYIGVLPFLLALTTLKFLARPSKKEAGINPFSQVILFSWGMILIGILLALGKNTPIFPFLYRLIPTFDMFNAPARFMLWMVFGLCILAGIGIHSWRPPIGRALYWLRLATAGAFAVTLGAGIAWIALGSISPSFVRATAIAGVWGLGTGLLSLFQPVIPTSARWSVWKYLVIVWVGMDMIFADWYLNPTVQAGFYSLISPGSASSENLPAGSRLYLNRDDEYQLKFRRFLRFKDYRLIEGMRNLRDVALPDINLLDNVASVNNFDPLLPARYSRWIESVEQLSAEKKTYWLALMNVGAQEIPDANRSMGISYKFGDPPGRFHWYPCALSAVKDDEAWLMTQNQMENVGNNVVGPSLIVTGAEQTSPDLNCQERRIGMLRIMIDHSDWVLVETQTDRNGWFMLSDVWYPGWLAQIDGQPVAVSEAFGTFRAVALPAGVHTVSFQYRPLLFYIGVIISCIGWIIMILWGLRRWVFNRQKTT